MIPGHVRKRKIAAEQDPRERQHPAERAEGDRVGRDGRVAVKLLQLVQRSLRRMRKKGSSRPKGRRNRLPHHGQSMVCGLWWSRYSACQGLFQQEYIVTEATRCRVTAFRRLTLSVNRSETSCSH